MRIKSWLILVIIFSTTLVSQAQSPMKVILDTDMDSDVDDVGALAMLHTLADHQVVDLLGVIVTSDDLHAPSCTDAINHYFKRPDIPIGVEKETSLREFSKYTKEISAEFAHDLSSYEEAEDATDLYRKLLSEQPDSSVVIISIGHLTNVRKLMESQPDRYSELNGMELIRKKVRLWSCMGGVYPEGKEANFYRPDPESTKVAVDNWPGAVVFAGWEIGNEIITGGEYLKRSVPATSPVWRSYELYNNFAGRPSWDQASILYAVAAESGYWELNDKGHVEVAEDGSNQWISGSPGNQSYLLKKIAPEEISKVIDALMGGIYPQGL